MDLLLPELLAANADYQRTGFHAAPRTPRPSGRLVVLACMDARLDLFRSLGLEVGQAHVLRNAGGRASDDAIRSLVVSTHLLGTREIGVLKALGASRGYIISVIEKEALLISLAGLIVGFIVSFVAGNLIHRAYGLVFEYGWAWALTAAVIGLGGGALGALYPAVRAASLDPVSALSYE